MRRIMPMLVAAALASTTLAGACGGDGKTAASPSTSSSAPGATGSTQLGGGASSPSTTAAGGTAATTKAGGSSPSTTAPSAGSAGSTSTTRAKPPQGKFKVTVTMGKACAGPGLPQTVTIKSKPQAVTTYVLEYSDHRNHSNSNGGVADGNGVFRDQFVVSPEAPPGIAYVTATVSTQKEGASFGEGSFTVGC